MTPYDFFLIAIITVAAVIAGRILWDIWSAVKYLIERTWRTAAYHFEKWLDYLRAKHQQKRREMWWEQGFESARGVVAASIWSTPGQVLENLDRHLESRRG